MSQIMYNYPAMFAHAGDMSGYAGTLQGLGADIASEQAALSNAWQGDTGYDLSGLAGAVEPGHGGAGAGLPGDGQHPRSQHAWRCYARDAAEAAKWGG